MKKIIFTLCTAMAAVLSVDAANDTYTYTILQEVDTTLSAVVSGIKLGSRDVHMIKYEYPSTDGEKKPATVSGVVLIPKEIAAETAPCDGVILYNRYFAEGPQFVPTSGGLEAENILLGNPLKPNYIVVTSDLIGFGSSADHQMAYLAGDTHARNSIDGLLAARQMLSDKNISQGKFLFNVGYSAGGTDALAVAKLRDMEYKDKLSFTKSFTGGAMIEFDTAYKELIKKEKWDSFTHLAIMLACINENYHLGIDYKDLFKEPLASSIPAMLKAKTKSALDFTGIDSLKQMMQPAYLDLESESAKKLLAKLAELNINKDWVPDTTQRYFYIQSRDDNYIPIQSGRCFVQWLKNNKFKPSLVPGKTNLQTSMLVFKLNHLITGVLWSIQSLVAMQYWPTVYHDGEQMRMYRDVVKDLNLMKVIKTLESWGIDLRKMISTSAPTFQSIQSDIDNGILDANASVTAILRGPHRRADIISQLTDILNKLGLSFSDALEMLDDSGISMADLMEVVIYLISPASAPAAADGGVALDSIEQKVEAPLYFMRYYEQTLANWFLLGGYDINYNEYAW